MNYLEKKSCLIGMLLGDSSIEKTSSKSARFSTVHCEKQKEYMLWKSEILKDFTSITFDEWTDKRGFKYVRSRTKNLPYFLTLRNQMYFQGRKSVTSHLMKILDWRGIAIWFLDDGCIYANSAQFATNSFNEAEHYLMKRWLAEKNDIHVSVCKLRQYFYLRTCAHDTAKIVDWVKKLNIPSMEYKINSYEKVQQPIWKNKHGQYLPGYNNYSVGERYSLNSMAT